jgi:hypothetical protein
MTPDSSLKELGHVYLASPYSNFPQGHDEAHRQVCVLAGELRQRGVDVYSPIAESHPIAVHCKVDKLDHAFWMRSCMKAMTRAQALLVADMEGWQVSKGVKMEIAFFKSAKLPVLIINPETLDVEYLSPGMMERSDRFPERVYKMALVV